MERKEQDLKLGIDARPLAYGITGNSRYLAEVLKILIPKRKESEFYLYSNKPIHPVFSSILEFPNVRLEIESSKLPGPLYLNFLLPGLLKKESIDVFWGTLQMLPFFKLPIRSVVNYHDLNFIQAPETMAKWNYWQHRLFSKRTLENADHVFCLSKMTRDGIVSWEKTFADKCEVVYPGVHKSSFQREPGLFPKPFFLAVGTLEPRKNLQMLIHAFQMYQEKFASPFSLVVLGRKGWGDEGNALYSFLKDPQTQQKKIFFQENPSDEKLSQAYAECSGFFFPSLHEGFGLPLLEAMINQKLCVASDLPVIREILDPNQDLFIRPTNTEQWAEAFARLAQKKSDNRVPPFSEKDWSWESTSQKIERAIWN